MLTNDPEIAARVRTIAAHGSDRKYVHDVVGFNSRLDTVQAVVLRAKLRRLSEWNELRRQAAARYSELLADVPGVRLPVTDPANDDVWHLYVVQVDERDRVLADLQACRDRRRHPLPHPDSSHRCVHIARLPRGRLSGGRGGGRADSVVAAVPAHQPTTNSGTLRSC